MKIDILSDIHIDMWHDASTAMNEKKFRVLFDNLFPKTVGEILVIAGDLGHYNKQNIELLKRFQDKYDYQIIYVWGNHDFYLTSKGQERQYKNGVAKARELKYMINEQDGMYHLDGDIIEINGVKLGGCNGWYDGSLFDGSFEETNEYWKEWMNDSKIKLFSDHGKLSFNSLHKLDLPKIEAIYQKCDVMITHVCPIADKDMFSNMYGEFHPVRSFYCFDGEKYVKNGTMKYWIFGHIHKPFQKEYFGKKLVCIRKVIYTTNIIEAVHRQFRTLTKTKGAFPNDNSLLKLLFMGIKNAQKKWTMPVRNWSLTISQLAIHFEGRLDKALNL